MRNFGIGVLVVLGLALLSVGAFTCNLFGIAANHVTNSVQNAVITYDDYQNIYATCNQLNNNLATIEQTPASDPQFANFSKAERINGVKIQLSRWVEEYNAKSAHIDKKWWKSGTLPQTLNVSDFSNYNYVEPAK